MDVTSRPKQHKNCINKYLIDTKLAGLAVRYVMEYLQKLVQHKYTEEFLSTYLC